MKFLLDESAEFRLAAFLGELGHDVTSVAHDYPAALADKRALAIAREEGRLLITNDRDFGELIVRRRLPHAGIIFFRLRTHDPRAKQRRLADVLARHGDQPDQFIVVTDRRIRVHHRQDEPRPPRATR